MRVLRFFLNSLLWVFVTIIITFSQIGVYSLVAAQSNKVDAVHISASDNEEVGYFDAYGFWGTDIRESCHQPAKVRIRNWFSWDWWKKGTEWADIALDRVIAVIKPAVVPVAQVNAVAEYYGRDIEYFILTPEGDALNKEFLDHYKSEDACRQELYEFFTLYRPDLMSEDIYNTVIVPYIESETSTFESVNSRVKTDDGKVRVKLPVVDSIEDFKSLRVDEESPNYLRWVKNNSVLYNHVWKIGKYNSSSYTMYFNKFVEEINGVRTIKTAAVTLYTMVYISFILSTIFVIMYPVSLIQARIVGKKRGKTTDTIA